MSDDLSIGELDEQWFIDRCSLAGREPSEYQIGIFLETLCSMISRKMSTKELREKAFELTFS